MGLLFGKPDRRFYANEIVRLAGMGRGTVHRELKRLTDAGILLKTEEGKQHYYQVNRQSPICTELTGLVRKTIGVADIVRVALGSVEATIKLAFIYGSVAKTTDRQSSDIDLMLVADDLSYSGLVECLATAEQALQRPVNPTIFTTAEFIQRLREEQSFVTRVMEQPKIMIKGLIDDFREPRNNR